MAKAYRLETRQRPQHLSLLLADTEQASELVTLLNSLPQNYAGAVLLACHGPSEEVATLASRVHAETGLSLRQVERSISLTCGKVYLIDPNLNYQINSSDQIVRLPAHHQSGNSLLDSLVQRFTNRCRVIVLSPSYRAQLEAVASGTRSLIELILLEHPTLTTSFKRPARYYALSLCRDLSELQSAINAPYKSGTSTKHRVQDQDRSAFKRILETVKHFKKADFANYKESSLINRIEKRMQHLRLASFEHYADLLLVDSAEIDILFESLFINMTRFFRDTQSFIELQRQLLRYIEVRKPEHLRIWSAGCSTGAEAYSLGLICDQIKRSLAPQLKATIYATDTDRSAIATAQAGVYSPEELEHIPTLYRPSTLRFDEKEIELGRHLLAEIIFECRDIQADPPAQDVDLIVCRNLFIYFDSTRQQQILLKFHSSLKPGGLLMLGRSESAGIERTHFIPIAQQAKIYKALRFSPAS